MNASRPAPELAVIVPVYNELENLVPLYERVRDALSGELLWELILVDDGSRDGSVEHMGELAARDPRVVALKLDRHRGQTSATAAGVRTARAPLVVTMDADMQSDPTEILLLLERLGSNDAVVGYRKRRQDSWLRRVSSAVANGVRNRLTGDTIRDTGCPLKLLRTDAVRSLPLFEGMHRFLPTLLRWHGYSVLEHPVSHYPRESGESKYGLWNRLFRSTRDLLAVRWMRSRIIPAVKASRVIRADDVVVPFRQGPEEEVWPGAIKQDDPRDRAMARGGEPS